MFGPNKVPQSLIDAVLKVTEGEKPTNEAQQLDEAEKVQTPTGMKVYGSSYGNSQKARADQTKKDIDNLKGPKDKEMKVKEGYSFADRLIDHAVFAEEVEMEINEVLSKDAKAGDWIHDFIHSDNPKFKGKTKAERKKMALGAYYAKQNEAWEGSKKDNEEDAKEAKKRGMTKAEWEKSEADKKHDMKEAAPAHMSDDEITTDTLAGRVGGGKSNSFQSFKMRVAPTDKEGDDSDEVPGEKEPEDTHARSSVKAKAGLGDKVDNLDPKYGKPNTFKEETELDEEQLDEISKKLAGSYRHAAAKDRKDMGHQQDLAAIRLGQHLTSGQPKLASRVKLGFNKIQNRIDKRTAGIKAASSRMKAEEVEESFADEHGIGRDIADKKEKMDRLKTPAKPGPLHNVAKGFKAFLKGKPEPMESVEVEGEQIDEKAGYSAKAGRAGKDLGKPGKNFAKIAKSAGKQYGSKESGEKVAGAILAKLRKEETLDEKKDLSPGQDDAPFEPPYTTGKPDNVKDKSGAVHTPMSRAKDLARTAMKRIKTEMLGKAPGNN
jgi:hypothetical protein